MKFRTERSATRPALAQRRAELGSGSEAGRSAASVSRPRASRLGLVTSHVLDYGLELVLARWDGRRVDAGAGLTPSLPVFEAAATGLGPDRTELYLCARDARVRIRDDSADDLGLLRPLRNPESRRRRGVVDVDEARREIRVRSVVRDTARRARLAPFTNGAIVPYQVFARASRSRVGQGRKPAEKFQPSPPVRQIGFTRATSLAIDVGDQDGGCPTPIAARSQ